MGQAKVDYRYPEPHRQLAAAIILRSIKEFREDAALQDEITYFFCSSWFEELCEMLEIDARRIRRKLGIGEEFYFA